MMHEHPQFGDAYDQQALGLEPGGETQALLRQHLADGCSVCAEEMARAQAAAVALGLGAAPVQPPASVGRALRRRIGKVEHAQARHQPSWQSAFWAALAGVIVLAAVAGLFYRRVGVQQRQAARMEAMLQQAQQQTRAALAGRKQMQQALAILTSAGTRVLAVQLTPAHPSARAFVNAERGVVLTSEHLPNLPADKTYEMWLLEAHGAPRPAGIFAATPSGQAIHLYSGTLGQAVGVAVSIEPASGSAAPTGPIVLAAKFGVTPR